MSKIRKKINGETIAIHTKLSWKFVKSNTWALSEKYPILDKLKVNLIIKEHRDGPFFVECYISSNYEDILGNYSVSNMYSLNYGIHNLENILLNGIDALNNLFSDLK